MSLRDWLTLSIKHKTHLKYIFAFSDNKCKHEVHFVSQQEKVDAAITHSKYYLLNQINVKYWKIFCKNFHESNVHLIYSHFQFN